MKVFKTFPYVLTTLEHYNIYISQPSSASTIQGVSKKMLVSGKMAITPLWKELGEEVIPFSKTTGSELSDEHKNFMIPSKND